LADGLTAADWTMIGLTSATLLVGIIAFVLVGIQIRQAKERARFDRLNVLKDRITSRATAEAMIDADEVLGLCRGPDGKPGLAEWNGLKAHSREMRVKRAGVLYVLNLIEEAAEDCERGFIDAAYAKSIFGERSASTAIGPGSSTSTRISNAFAGSLRVTRLGTTSPERRSGGVVTARPPVRGRRASYADAEDRVQSVTAHPRRRSTMAPRIERP
jgi:hypothetical protein